MNFLLLIRDLFPLILPMVVELEHKVDLPFLVGLKYKALSKSTEAICKSVLELRQKVEDSATSDIADERRRGLKLACGILRTLAEKVLKVVDAVEKD